MMILLGSYTVSMGYFMGIFLDGAITNEMSSWAPVNMAGTSQQENDGWEAIDFTVKFPQSKGIKKGTQFWVWGWCFWDIEITKVT